MSEHHITAPATAAMSTVPDWDAVRARVARPGWARDVLAALREDFEHWRPRLRVPGPDQASAWTHHYFCDDDGESLVFDPDLPDEHVCPACGRVYRGEPWDGAWRTRMHNQAAAQAQRAALLARLDDDAARRDIAVDVVTEIVTRYAADYRRYALHGVNVGTARVGPQNLDESVWVIALLRAVRWAGPLLSGATHAAARALAVEVAEVLRPQLGMIHNIHCWIVAALAECAVVAGDEELLQEVTTGPLGAREQILQGIHPEGLWFEVNPAYHFYAVNALLSFVEVAGVAALAGEPAARLLRAVQAPAELAYSDGRVPAYGDGWPDTFLGGFAQTAEVASALLPGAESIAAAYVDDRPDGLELWFGAGRVGDAAAALTGRRTVGALVLGADTLTADAPATPGSFVWPGPGIGVLRRDGVRVAMRFGPDSGWHDHHDKLAVDAECGSWRSLDLGTTGYGSDLTVFMRSQVAHNLLVVGERPQPKHEGELLHADESTLVARSRWNDAEVRRTLRLTGDGWTDEVEATAAVGTPLEWVFHGDGVVVAESAAGGAAGEVVALPDDDLGHGWLTDARSLPVDDGVTTVTWDHPDAPRLRLELPPGWTAFCAVGAANPNGLPLGVVGARGPAGTPTSSIRARFSRAAVAP